MSGQSINDRITAARHSIAGQGLAKSVCKATTEQVIGPKKKHLDYLLRCTNEPNVSIPQLANLLIERTQNQAWVIVFKALITVHTLMCYGNERFTQYLASSNCKFNLSSFQDKTGTPDQPQLSYDMSTFIRRYAKYINEKAISYRTVAFDFCKAKRGKQEGAVRMMSTDQLLKTLPILQVHLDALLDFDCQASELNNGVINASFMLLFRDLIRLFACYNDGIINLLEKYFDMNKKQCREALDCYKKFLIRMDRVSEFLKVAEAVGMDKSEIPDLTQAPSSLLEALEGHLASLEGKKVSTASAGAAAEVAAAVTSNGAMLDDVVRKQALAEEEAMYEKLKADAAKNNPFLSSPSAETPPAPPVPASAAPAPPAIIDLFSADAPVATPPAPPAAADEGQKASEELLAGLLQLGGNQSAGNPFADTIAPAPVPAAPPATNAFDGFGDILKPVSGSGSGPAVAAPLGGGAPQIQPAVPQKLISGDLDSSLSSLVDNLNMKAPPAKPQWQSQKSPNKTGGVNWSAPAPTQPNAAPRPPWNQNSGVPSAVPPTQFDPFGAL